MREQAGRERYSLEQLAKLVSEPVVNSLITTACGLRELTAHGVGYASFSQTNDEIVVYTDKHDVKIRLRRWTDSWIGAHVTYHGAKLHEPETACFSLCPGNTWIEL